MEVLYVAIFKMPIDTSGWILDMCVNDIVLHTYTVYVKLLTKTVPPAGLER
jgi:hypothetical protein